MLLKMLAIERASQTTGVKQRQIYVTQSRVLASRVKDHFQGLLSASTELANAERDSDLSTLRVRTEPRRRLLDDDDEDDTKDELPLSFGALTDKHFPLFVSFEKVYYRLYYSVH